MSLDPVLKPDQRIDEYLLIARLSSYSHVWHAYDTGAQREVVLKFVNDGGSASREGAILADIEHPNILKLLRKFEHQGVHVLVFEYVAGVRLDKAIREGLSHEHSYAICLDISSALAAIHRFGLFHGDLSPFNVIWSSDKSKAFLIDFGAMGGCTVLSATPEHDPANKLSIGPHTDIVGLGRILLLLLPEMKHLYDRCLVDDIALRPTAQTVYDMVKQVRDRRKMMLRGAAIVFVLLLAMAIGSYFRKPTKDEIIADLINQKASQESVATLKTHLFDSGYQNFRDLILKGLANHRRSLGKESLLVKSLDEYVAVFAVEKNPVIIFEEGYLELGDWVVIAGEGGYLLEINRGNVILQTTNGSKEIAYPKAEVMGLVTQSFKPINIRPGRNNFFKVLRTVCEVNSWRFEDNGFDDGVLGGSWDTVSYEEFFKKLIGHATKKEYTVSMEAVAPPRSAIAGDPFWVIRNKALSSLLADYEPLIGYKCEYVGQRDPSDLYYPVMQFHELLAVMNLQAEIVDNQIRVKEGESK